MPQISVIVPVYNAERFLKKCVDSVRNQSFSDLEIILVDDGSLDHSPEICDRLAEEDSRIRVIHQKNGGVSRARNTGLEAASGEYVIFLDSDDYIDSCMYEKMIRRAEEFDCDMVMCDCVKEFPDHSAIYSHPIRGGLYSRKQLETEYFPHLLIMENVEYPATISNWLLLFRRELAKELRYSEGIRYSEDLLFGAQLLYRAESFYYMKGEAYYHYYMNPQSATHRFVSDKWDDYLRLHSKIRQSFGRCPDFDFQRQIDLCLLFFLYNAVGDMIHTQQLTRGEKKQKILDIISCAQVKDMFSRVQVSRLPVSNKQKLITFCYSRQTGIGLLLRVLS